MSPLFLDILRHVSFPPSWMGETSLVREVWIFSGMTHCNTFQPQRSHIHLVYATGILE